MAIKEKARIAVNPLKGSEQGQDVPEPKRPKEVRGVIVKEARINLRVECLHRRGLLQRLREKVPDPGKELGPQQGEVTEGNPLKVEATFTYFERQTLLAGLEPSPGRHNQTVNRWFILDSRSDTSLAERG